MASRKQTQRILRATKNQIAAQLQALRPGLTGAEIVDIYKAGDATFYEAEITAGFTALGPIEEKNTDYIQIDEQFIVTNLTGAIVPSVQPGDIEDFRISEDDPTKVEVVLKRT